MKMPVEVRLCVCCIVLILQGEKRVLFPVYNRRVGEGLLWRIEDKRRDLWKCRICLRDMDSDLLDRSGGVFLHGHPYDLLNHNIYLFPMCVWILKVVKAFPKAVITWNSEVYSFV